MSKLRELTVTVDWNNDLRLFALRSHDPKFVKIKKKVLGIGDHTCSYCAFRSEHHMEIVNIDRDYYNNKIDNFAVCCPFCLLSHFPTGIGRDFGGGTIIYCAELSQNEINAIIHVMFSSMYNCTEYEKASESFYKAFKSRADQVESKLGRGLSEPRMLSQMLVDAPLKDSKKVAKTILKDLRIVPNYEDFRDILASWAREAVLALK